MDVDTFPNNRDAQIEIILSSLVQLSVQSNAEKYAIEQNLLFFKSIRSVFSYLRWLYKVRKHIHKEQLLEINELLPALDVIFHKKMAEIERRPSPGIVRPAVEHMKELITKSPHDRRLRIASLGSGSMEVERQIIEQLQKDRFKGMLSVIGFDVSPNTRSFAERNLSELPNVRIVQASKLTEKKLLALEQETREPILIVISDNDIFTLRSSFTSQTFDLVMTALFLHHLSETKRKQLINDMRALAPETLNYDGFMTETIIPILSITGWHSPVFLNAAIFSSVRFPSRTEVQTLHAGARVDFYKHGHYRAIFSV